MSLIGTLSPPILLTPREAEELIGIIRDANQVCSRDAIAGHDRYVAELLSDRLARMGFSRGESPAVYVFADEDPRS